MLLTLGLGGCGTFVSKVTGPDNSQGYWYGVGHPYEGVSVDVLTVKCIWQMSPPQNIALRWLVTIGLLIDFPLSLVADTFVLPIDLVVKPQRSRVDLGDCNANPRSL